MNRKLTTDRLYNLGQFKHLQLHDELEVPSEFDKPEIVNLLIWMQVLSFEKAYYKYMSMYENYLSKMKYEEAEKYIIEQMSETTKQLNDLFKNGKLEN